MLAAIGAGAFALPMTVLEELATPVLEPMICSPIGLDNQEFAAAFADLIGKNKPVYWWLEEQKILIPLEGGSPS